MAPGRRDVQEMESSPLFEVALQFQVAASDQI